MESPILRTGSIGSVCFLSCKGFAGSTLHLSEKNTGFVTIEVSDLIVHAFVQRFLTPSFFQFPAMARRQSSWAVG